MLSSWARPSEPRSAEVANRSHGTVFGTSPSPRKTLLDEHRTATKDGRRCAFSAQGIRGRLPLSVTIPFQEACPLSSLVQSTEVARSTRATDAQIRGQVDYSSSIRYIIPCCVHCQYSISVFVPKGYGETDHFVLCATAGHRSPVTPRAHSNSLSHPSINYTSSLL
jgi:hypothetical protein